MENQKKTSPKYAPEVRERAVRMVFEHADQYLSQWEAITSIASKSVVQRINYRYTPTNFGSRRMWFECPNYSTHDFPEKPKWMRWHSYCRLRAEDSQLMRTYEDGFCSIAMAFLWRHG